MSIRRRKITIKDGKAFRIVKYRTPDKSTVHLMNGLADEILNDCHRLFNRITGSADLACNGLARLVLAAQDCRAVALGLQDEAFWAFVSGSTAEWFRTRGFAEWYCLGAGTAFQSSRPRILSVGVVGQPKTRRRRRNPV